MSFADAKAAGKLVFGQLPVLDADGILIAQSGSQGYDSIDILNFEHKTVCKTGRSSGTTSVLEYRARLKGRG